MHRRCSSASTFAPKGEEQDITGTAWFGSLWVGGLPRVVLTARAVETGGPQPTTASFTATSPAVIRGGVPAQRVVNASFLVFARDLQADAGQADHVRPSTHGVRAAPAPPLEVACLVSGFAVPKYDVLLDLQDESGRTIARHEEHFTTAQPRVLATNTKSDSNGANKTVAPARRELCPRDVEDPSRRGRILSRPREVIPTALEEKDGSRPDGTTPTPRSTCTAAIGLAIVARQPLPPGSEFGWSLDPGDDSQGLVPLADLLTQSGIRWVKFPFVCSPRQDNEAAKKQPKPGSSDPAEPLINFSDRLTRNGMQVAGVLLPPQDPDRASTSLLAAEAFALDPKIWYPSFEPILARLGTEIRCWQIGDDCDSSSDRL